MSTLDKQRVVTVFEKLDGDIQEQIKLKYSAGYSQHLIKFPDKDGNKISALRFEGEEKIYLVKMSIIEAEQLVVDDNDYDYDGQLTDLAREDYEEKYGEDDDDYEDED